MPADQQTATIADQQIAQFEAERASHTLNLARLNAIPAAKRNESWIAAARVALDAIDTIDGAITATKAAAKAARDGIPIVDVAAVRADVEKREKAK